MTAGTRESPSAPPVSPGGIELAATPGRLRLMLLLVVLAAVGWRRGAYYSGGLDIVFVAKAGLSMLAFAVALTTPRAKEAWTRYRATPVVWLVAYAGVATLGGVLNGRGLPSVILSMRLGLLAATLVLVVVSYTWREVVGALTWVLIGLSLFSGATGITSLASEGRLYGGIPPLNANEICRELTFAVLVLVWRAFHSQARRADYVLIPLLLGVIVLTGSRTGLGALLVALLVATILAPRVPRVFAGAATLAIPAGIYVLFYTPVFADLAGRGDVTTLSNRTVAWQAALNYADSTLQHFIGAGLDVKTVPVTALYRTEQILDSSWVSAIVQAGYVGTAVLALFILATIGRAVAAPPGLRGLVLPVLMAMTLSSFLESGLMDTTTSFIMFFLVSLFVHRVPDGTDR